MLTIVLYFLLANLGNSLVPNRIFHNFRFKTSLDDSSEGIFIKNSKNFKLQYIVICL